MNSVKTFAATIAATVVGFVALLTVVLLVIVGIVVGTLNNESRLRIDFHAQQKSNESSFDKTWKVIQQQAGVADHERESFRDTYSEIMSETKGVAGNGQLASFFNQAKIDISPELFSKLMTTIEAQRESFHRDQQKLLQLQAEQNKCFEVQPSGMILAIMGRSERVKANIVTSSKTDEAFQSGKDDDVDLFN